MGQQSMGQQPIQTHSMGQTSPSNSGGSQSSKFNQDKNDGFHWIKIVLGLGLIVGVGFAIYWVSQKYEKPVLYTPPRIVSSPKMVSNNPKNNLLDRLKGLEIDAI